MQSFYAIKIGWLRKLNKMMTGCLFARESFSRIWFHSGRSLRRMKKNIILASANNNRNLWGMVMSVNLLLIQAIGFLGTILFFLSYQCKNNKMLFRVQFVSYLCYTVHLLLLGAITGGISYILNTVRSLCLSSESHFLKSKRVWGLLCALQIVTLVFTWGVVLCITCNCKYCRNNRGIYIQCSQNSCGRIMC